MLCSCLQSGNAFCHDSCPPGGSNQPLTFSDLHTGSEDQSNQIPENALK